MYFNNLLYSLCLPIESELVLFLQIVSSSCHTVRKENLMVQLEQKRHFPLKANCIGCNICSYSSWNTAHTNILEPKGPLLRLSVNGKKHFQSMVYNFRRKKKKVDPFILRGGVTLISWMVEKAGNCIALITLLLLCCDLGQFT